MVLACGQQGVTDIRTDGCLDDS